MGGHWEAGTTCPGGLRLRALPGVPTSPNEEELCVWLETLPGQPSGAPTSPFNYRLPDCMGVKATWKERTQVPQKFFWSKWDQENSLRKQRSPFFLFCKDPFPSCPVPAPVEKPRVGGTGVKSGRHSPQGAGEGGRGFTSLAGSGQAFRRSALHPESQASLEILQPCMCGVICPS